MYGILISEACHYEFKPNVSYGTKGCIPKAKHRAKKLCMDKITLEYPLDFHEVQDTDITFLNKSNLTSYFFPGKEQTTMIFFPLGIR